MNRGAVETAKAISKRGISVNAAATLLGTDSGNLSRVLTEKEGRKPGRALASRILSEFGISPTLWDEPVEAANPDEPTEHPHTGT